jgi:hypothetical protein
MLRGPEAEELAKRLHPEATDFGEALTDAEVQRVRDHFPAAQVSSQEVLACLRAFPKASATGPSGVPVEILQLAMKSKIKRLRALGLDVVTNWVNLALDGVIAPQLLCARLVLPRKEKGGARPIALLEITRRLISKAALRSDDAVGDAAESLRGVRQYGVRTRGGADRVAALLRHCRERGLHVSAVDLKNAYNSLNRNAIIRMVTKHAPGLLRYTIAVLATYGTELILEDLKILADSGSRRATPSRRCGSRWGWPRRSRRRTRGRGLRG